MMYIAITTKQGEYVMKVKTLRNVYIDAWSAVCGNCDIQLDGKHSSMLLQDEFAVECYECGIVWRMPMSLAKALGIRKSQIDEYVNNMNSNQ